MTLETLDKTPECACERWIKEMNAILKQEEAKDIMYSAPQWVLDKISECIDALEEVTGYDPTPEYLYDDGEPPVTAAEIHNAHWKQHQELHK
jgi:ATP phosphoribosyltransferase